MYWRFRLIAPVEEEPDGWWDVEAEEERGPGVWVREAVADAEGREEEDMMVMEEGMNVKVKGGG